MENLWMHRTYKGIEAETKFCVEEVREINEEQKRLDKRRQDLNEEEGRLNERRQRIMKHREKLKGIMEHIDRCGRNEQKATRRYEKA